MKKQFEIPAVEVKNLTPQNDVMAGIFAKSAGPTSTVTNYIVDTTTDTEGQDIYDYWKTK
ncbi:MAG: hypothetical protein ACI4SS_00105 [Clostridia bacterium]